MSNVRASFYTDEELLKELKKLGHTDVADEVFDMVKKDVSKLLLQDLVFSLSSLKTDENISTKLVRKTKSLQKKNESSGKKFYELRTSDFSEKSSNNNEKSKCSGTQFLSKKSAGFTSLEEISSTDNSSSNASVSVISIHRYRSGFQNNKEHTVAKPHSGEDDQNSSSSSLSSLENKIKRKVLRRKNGRAIITEQLLDMPRLFNSSYPESDQSTNSSFSANESNTSTDNLDTRDSTSLLYSVPSHASHSLETKSICSTQSRRMTRPKKKSDPVSMYNYYKTFWNNFKPPGEKNHNKLRWTVRDKMLEYHL